MQKTIVLFLLVVLLKSTSILAQNVSAAADGAQIQTPDKNKISSPLMMFHGGEEEKKSPDRKQTTFNQKIEERQQTEGENSTALESSSDQAARGAWGGGRENKMQQVLKNDLRENVINAALIEAVEETSRPVQQRERAQEEDKHNQEALDHVTTLLEGALGLEKETEFLIKEARATAASKNFHKISADALSSRWEKALNKAHEVTIKLEKILAQQAEQIAKAPHRHQASWNEAIQAVQKYHSTWKNKVASWGKKKTKSLKNYRETLFQYQQESFQHQQERVAEVENNVRKLKWRSSLTSALLFGTTTFLLAHHAVEHPCSNWDLAHHLLSVSSGYCNDYRFAQNLWTHVEKLEEEARDQCLLDQLGQTRESSISACDKALIEVQSHWQRASDAKNALKGKWQFHDFNALNLNKIINDAQQKQTYWANAASIISAGKISERQEKNILRNRIQRVRKSVRQLEEKIALKADAIPQEVGERRNKELQEEALRTKRQGIKNIFEWINKNGMELSDAIDDFLRYPDNLHFLEGEDGVIQRVALFGMHRELMSNVQDPDEEKVFSLENNIGLFMKQLEEVLSAYQDYIYVSRASKNERVNRFINYEAPKKFSQQCLKIKQDAEFIKNQSQEINPLWAEDSLLVVSMIEESIRLVDFIESQIPHDRLVDMETTIDDLVNKPDDSSMPIGLEELISTTSGGDTTLAQELQEPHASQSPFVPLIRDHTQQQWELAEKAVEIFKASNKTSDLENIETSVRNFRNALSTDLTTISHHPNRDRAEKLIKLIKKVEEVCSKKMESYWYHGSKNFVGGTLAGIGVMVIFPVCQFFYESDGCDNDGYVAEPTKSISGALINIGAAVSAPLWVGANFNDMHSSSGLAHSSQRIFDNCHDHVSLHGDALIDEEQQKLREIAKSAVAFADLISKASLKK